MKFNADKRFTEIEIFCFPIFTELNWIETEESIKRLYKIRIQDMQERKFCLYFKIEDVKLISPWKFNNFSCVH